MEKNVAELPAFDRVWAWYVRNQKQVIWGTVVVVIVALAASLYFWKQNQIEVSASEDLARVEAEMAVSRGTHNESPEAYLKVANEHPGTEAGARALLQAAATLFAQGKYADAQTQFQKFGRDYPESQLRGTAMLGNATCLDALGKTDEAAAAYKALSDQRPGEFVAEQAKFALARIYELQGKLDQALVLYEELARADANGSIGNESGLKAEELRMKMPSSAATTTNAPVVSPLPLLSTQPGASTNKP